MDLDLRVAGALVRRAQRRHVVGVGYNGTGQLGDGTTTNGSAPTQVGASTSWKAVEGGNGHSPALRTDGTLWAWG